MYKQESLNSVALVSSAVISHSAFPSWLLDFMLSYAVTCGPEDVSVVGLYRRHIILSGKTERKVILMPSSHKFDDDVGWLYWKYGVRVWAASLWLGMGVLDQLCCCHIDMDSAP